MICATHLSWRRFYRMPILWLIWKLFDNGVPTRCRYCKTPFFGTRWPGDAMNEHSRSKT